MAPSKDPLFSAGEHILCFHGPLLYDAKCLQLQRNSKDTYDYWVHYSGWNKSWDEWVPETRILKHTDSNVQRQKDLFKSQKALKAGNKKATKTNRTIMGRDAKPTDAPSEGSVHDPDSRSSTPILDPKKKALKRASPTPSIDSFTDSKKSKKNKTDHAVESEAQFLNKVEIKIKLPEELKPWIVDEYFWVVKKKKLAILPAKITVDKVLDMYLQHKKSKGGKEHTISIVESISSGIKEYFNVMLGTKLLYKEERAQFASIMKENPDTDPSAIYGPHFLIRLFIKMGYTLAYTALNEKTMALVVTTFHDFLRYMGSNVAILFNEKNYA